MKQEVEPKTRSLRVAVWPVRAPARAAVWQNTWEWPEGQGTGGSPTPIRAPWGLTPHRTSTWGNGSLTRHKVQGHRFKVASHGSAAWLCTSQLWATSKACILLRPGDGGAGRRMKKAQPRIMHTHHLPTMHVIILHCTHAPIEIKILESDSVSPIVS